MALFRLALCCAMTRRIAGRGFRIDLRAADESVAGGVDRVQGILQPEALSDAGWGLLFIGVLMLRADGASVPWAAGHDRMFDAGLSYGAFVAASAGDALLDRAEAGVTGEVAAGTRWKPPADAETALQMASKLSAGVVMTVMTAGQAKRLQDEWCERLKQEVSGIDEEYAGWGLSVFGAWLGSSAQDVARPIGRSRVLGRPSDNARTGCALAGALLTHIGSALLGL